MSYTVTTTAAMAAAEVEILAKYISEETQDNLIEAMADAPGHAEVKKCAYDDVKALVQTICQIRDLFHSVNVDLLHFDHENFTDADGNSIQLQARWSPQMEVRTPCPAYEEFTVDKSLILFFESVLRTTFKQAVRPLRRLRRSFKVKSDDSEPQALIIVILTAGFIAVQTVITYSPQVEYNFSDFKEAIDNLCNVRF